MEFQETPLGEEAQLIAREGKESYFMYEATFVTDKEEIDVLSVTTVDWIRDYRSAAADEIQIRVIVQTGQYLNRILPFKENLKMTVRRIPVDSRGSFISEPIVEQTFDAFLQMESETAATGSSPELATEFSGDLTGIKTVVVQLQEEVFSMIRSTMVGGVFRDSIPFDVLKSLLFSTGKDFLVEGEVAMLGVNSVEPNNKTKRANMVIPHGTPLVALADKLQTQHGGIYTAGIGCYFQKGYWYVWPLHNYSLYDVAERTASFIIAPSVRYRGVERTWRTVGKHTSILITGGVRRSDPSEILMLNDGNAVRFANDDVVMGDFLEVKNNKAVAKRTNNVNEYEAVKRQGRSMSRVSQDRTTNNAFQEASKVAARNGAFLTVNWENSNPDVITPGLQCEIGFLVNMEVKFINGVVVHAHGLSALAGKGLHQKVHQLTTEVVIMVDRLSPIYQEYLDEQK